MTVQPAVEPTILRCGSCNEEIYRATPEKYNPDELRKAVHEHKARCCPRRTEVPA
jgi:hypothetical protein